MKRKNMFWLLFFSLMTSQGALAMQTMKVTSDAFKSGDAIPTLYTCTGKGYSPFISWEKVSGDVKSYAVIVDDPDAPGGTFVHWVVFNLPPTTMSLAERADIRNLNGIEGLNSAKQNAYMGPCPPSGKHRYFFRVYALDVRFELPASTTADQLKKAMEGHILGMGELMGTFAK